MRKLGNVIQESEWWPKERVRDFGAALREYLKFDVINVLYTRHGLFLHVILVSLSYTDTESE